MEYRAKYLCEDDEFILATLIEAAKAENAATVEYEDCEEEFRSENLSHQGLIDLVDGMAEEFWLWFYDKDGKRLGGFASILGNGDYTTVADYIDNEWCGRVWKRLKEVCEKDENASQYW